MTDETKTTPSEGIKPGWQTTEFWLSTLATLVSLAYATGLVHQGTSTEKVLGFVAAALATMGYSVSRAIVKK
jgi:hypothetical protein